MKELGELYEVGKHHLVFTEAEGVLINDRLHWKVKGILSSGLYSQKINYIVRRQSLEEALQAVYEMIEKEVK